MTKYKYIFFDLDRTLWDFDRNSSDTLEEIIKEFGLEATVTDAAEFIYLYNKYNDELWNDYRKGNIKKYELRFKRFKLLLSHYGIGDLKHIEDISRFYLNAAPLKTSLIMHAKEILIYLHPSYRLHIISNGFYDVQLTKIKNSGISPYISKVFTSDRIGYSKPKAGIFEYAITSINAKKSECIMIGDDILNDVQGARNAGIDQIYFNPENRETSIQATFEISDLIELKRILEVGS